MTDRFYSRRGSALLQRFALSSLAIGLVSSAPGCASPGSAFGTGGATGVDTGGFAGPTGGSTGSGGSVGNGSGGANLGTGTGGGLGTGGESAQGTGGTSGPGTGGGMGTGGAVGSGGTAVGSGGRGGTTGPGTGGVAAGGRMGTGGAIGSGGVAPTGSGGGVALPACPKPAGMICHEFYANDNARFQVNYVNEFDPSKNWTVSVGDNTANSPRTIEIVDNPLAKSGKAVLVSLNKGYGEFDTVDGKSLVKVQQYTGVTGACRIPTDGTTALATNDLIRIVSPTGAMVRSFALPAGPELRAINRNPTTGNFWFSKTESVYEVTAQGAQVWTANLGVGTKGYAVWWRAGGGAYGTTGDPSTVVELNAAGSVISQVGTKAKFPFLDFFSGFVRLANGNFVVANWLGHLAAPAADAPEVVELTPQNTLVWQWGNQTLARQITNVFVIR